MYQASHELIGTIRKHTLENMQGVLGRVFARADDWLFDLAQKEGAAGGSPHLDGMRALRVSRTPLERGFRRHFESCFDNFVSGRQPIDALDGRILSLVEEDQLEEQLASEMVVEAVARAHGPALEAIERRFSVMAGVVKLDPALNPLSAANLANAVRSAQRDVPLPSNVRVVLFKFYERELVQNLETLLTEINARLVAAGILPELGNPRPVEPTEAAPAPAKPAIAPSNVRPSGGDDKEVFDAICEMLHSWRPQYGEQGAAQAAAANAGRPVQRPLAMTEMLSVLSLMQPQVPESVTQAMGRPDASLSALLKQEMVKGAGRIGLAPEQVHMSPEDEDAVDLVGMLFDVVFDERDFEQVSRTLMSRMVVPFVKAALIDRQMFMYKTHPARRLLNSMAEACEGNRGEGAQERELLQKAEGTVDRLVAEFNEDMAIFETLEQELRSFLDQHRRRIELAERRAAEAQRGQERLEQARELAARELEQRSRGLSMPGALDDFLTRCWTHHLSMVALREGPDSPGWQAALAVADGLLELLPRAGRAGRLAGPTVQGFRDPIEAILASSGITGDTAKETIDSLTDSLDALTHGDSDAAKVVIKPIVAAPAAAEAPAKDAKPALAIVADKDRLDYNAEDIGTIRALKVGAWIHLAGEDGKLHPAKLSWVSPISSRLMFVNRRGVRVLVASLEELAALKKKGELVVREQEHVFDQVLHRVMGRLRKGET